MKRFVYITVGLLCVGLGALGVIVPGLPTTPFLLLASWCFYRSSQRLQDWLLKSWLGAYIRSYHRRGGMTAMVLLSVFFFIPKDSVAKIIVPIAGAAGVLTVVFAVPNAKKEE